MRPGRTAAEPDRRLLDPRRPRRSGSTRSDGRRPRGSTTWCWCRRPRPTRASARTSRRWRRRPDVTVRRLASTGLSRSRNAALDAARGEILLVADDDVTHPPGAFEAIRASSRRTRGSTSAPGSRSTGRPAAQAAAGAAAAAHAPELRPDLEPRAGVPARPGAGEGPPLRRGLRRRRRHRELPRRGVRLRRRLPEGGARGPRGAVRREPAPGDELGLRLAGRRGGAGARRGPRPGVRPRRAARPRSASRSSTAAASAAATSGAS